LSPLFLFSAKNQNFTAEIVNTNNRTTSKDFPEEAIHMEHINEYEQ
jgi:hypothetical protein